MIAISSARPFAQSTEYAVNQERASRSWIDKFGRVYYFGHYEGGLCHKNTFFARKDEDWPRIKQMAEFASQMDSVYVALINADIVLTDGITDVMTKMHDLSLPAATSYRYGFDPVDYPNLDNAIRHKEDRGMDIFIAHPGIWKLVVRDIPEYLRFGHPTWDTWICGYFCEHLGYGFRHFTENRCVFHPKHGGRLTPHSAEIRNDQKYFTLAKRPSPL